MGTVAELGLVTSARIQEGKKSKLTFKRESCINRARYKILKGKAVYASQVGWESSGHRSELAVTAVMTELVADGRSAAQRSRCRGLQRLTLPARPVLAAGAACSTSELMLMPTDWCLA